MPRSLVLLLGLASLALSAGAEARDSPAGDRLASEVVADLTAAQRALSDALRDGGESSAGFKSSAQRLCDLVAELRRVEPAHAALAKWTPRRWSLMTQVLDQAAEVEAEVARLLETEPRAPLDWEARLARVRARTELARGHPTGALKALAEAVDDLIARHPDRPELAAVCFDYADFRRDDPRLRAELLKRFVERFPDHERAAAARRWIAQPGRVGSELRLEFTDALGRGKVSIQALRGKVVVVDFWATWCAPCLRDLPEMKALYAKYKDRGVEFIGVSLDRSEAEGGLAALRELCRREGVAWPQYYQGKHWQSEFSSSLGIRSIPTVFLVDHEGKLASTDARGQLDRLIPEALERAKAARR